MTPQIQSLSVSDSIESATIDEDDEFEKAVRYYEELDPQFASQPKEFSKNLQRMRNELMARLDRSRLLQHCLFTPLPPDGTTKP